jgi:putative transcriptional regulator
MIIKTRIKELRARYNLTQDELARLVGVTRRTMLYLEKGKYNPSLLLAHNVAKALKTDIDEVFIIENGEYEDTDDESEKEA